MNKIASVLLLTTLAGGLAMPATYAQSKKKKKDKKEDAKEVKQDTPAAKTSDDGFVQMEGGMEYKIIEDVPGDVYPTYGDYMEIHLVTLAADSVIFDTHTAMGDNKPAPLQLRKSPFKGDLMVALQKLTAGDSAQVRVLVDSLVAAGAQQAPWMEMGKNQKLIYNLRVVTVTPKAVKEKQEAEKAAKQGVVDEGLIKDYLAEHKIKAQKTESGLYYKIDEPGTGDNAAPGQKVTVNYTGMLLNGEKFDSNTDPAFGHVQPFDFMLGTGSVIKGWDEGIALLKKGGKATLYIPSTLAYGANSPSPKIPPHSVLVFDVELLDIAGEARQN